MCRALYDLPSPIWLISKVSVELCQCIELSATKLIGPCSIVREKDSHSQKLGQQDCALL
jgi:hypothetical protein